MSIENKELNFEGTKEELFDKFFCVNAYDRQFYPQFKAGWAEANFLWGGPTK